MSNAYDLETAVEDALIALIAECTQVKTVRWDDVSEKHLSPASQTGDAIRVRVVAAEDEPGTINTYAGMRMLVDIAAFASRRRDLASRKVNELRGVIRSVFAQSDIVDQINNFGTILVYAQGVIPVESFDESDDKNYIKGITVQVVAHPKL